MELESWGEVCLECQRGFVPSSQEIEGLSILSVAPYRPPVKGVLYHWKEQNGHPLNPFWVARLEKLLEGVWKPPFVIVPIPQHPQREYGFWLGRPLLKLVNAWVKVYPHRKFDRDLYFKKLFFSRQKSLDRKTRKEMRKGIFVYRGQGLSRVVLLDDIVTTGATLLEARDCLQSQGAKVLGALTLAYA